ncbi:MULTISPECIES: AAA family ATPase [Acidovorax]|uniref:AAA family ATPase n=1 Tax=Acidovorax facilis TaxID=12917 RepID=A0ABV8D436_9BURK|nr:MULTISPECIES: AAA family ATPase [Acidovorax]KQB56016.1 DNA primase [Acidovorax sp. SD340]MBO1006323.1 AAA family ATPase [Acidovorax sp. SD340]MCO4240647.1 AAA family ATPase [Acidovorax facilis]
MAADTARAHDALFAIPPDLPRDEWVRAGMAAQAAGLDFDTFNDWSAQAGNYDERAVRDTWRSFKLGTGLGAGTLFRVAAAHGWRMGKGKPQKRPIRAPKKAVEPSRKPAPGMSPDEVWARCEPATAQHGYIVAKAAAGVPLDTLRVLPAGDALRIAGQSMAGALVLPAFAPDGALQSLQLIPPPGAGKKLNLPGAPMAGASFTVGELVPGAPVALCEGVGTAWACWRATGHPAVACFGWGNVGKVAEALRQRDTSARLVLVPDTGKESDAAEIAQAVGAAVAYMPQGEPQNFDANDLAQRDGHDVLAGLLEAATAPPKPEPRYKLLGADELRNLPPLAWRVRGVLPAVGLAALYGPSASGKSFLAFDMAAAIAEGQRWFDCRVEAAPVVYAALEGEAGFKLRAQAWETSRGRALPDSLRIMLQPFKLTDSQDVIDLADVVPRGAVVVLDTLNRAAPTADENSSRDMGEILEAAKTLQTLTGGLVVLVHHTGKNAAAGLRGHSSLFAAMDAAIEVSREGDRREWKVTKSKDGQDGTAHQFKLQVEALGTEPTGEAITSCVVVRDTAVEDVRAVKLPQGGNQRVILDALRELLQKAGPFNPLGAPASCPPGRPAVELEVMLPRLAERLTVAPDRKTERARDGITGLVSRGVVGCDKGWIWLA